MHLQSCACADTLVCWPHIRVCLGVRGSIALMMSSVRGRTFSLVLAGFLLRSNNWDRVLPGVLPAGRTFCHRPFTSAPYSVKWGCLTVQVPVVELLEVTVWDADEFSNDKCLGVVEIDIAEDVAKVPGGRIYKTWYLQVRTSFLEMPIDS